MPDLLVSSDACFMAARERVLSETTTADGIGTLSEKTLHRILKLYIEPDEARHEQKFLGSVADILEDDRVYEIQTHTFSYLVKKLRKFLPERPVTVVYPIAAETTLHYIDKATGDISSKPSPRRRTASEVFREIYPIREFLADENFTLRLVFLAVDEYKYRDGSGKHHTIGATRVEKIPSRILREEEYRGIDAYRAFLPDALPEPFTQKDFTKQSKMKDRYAWYGLQTLLYLGLCARDESARPYLYTKM